MINYNKELSETLRKDKSFISMYGIDIQTKAIPDETRHGVLDQREFEMAKAQAELFSKNENGSFEEFSIENIRQMMGFPNLNMNTIEIYTRYEEFNFGGNVVKIWGYYPRKPEGKTGRPGFIYIHGGAWVGGTPFAVENTCKLLAERADCVVFNVDYSLAPEKPYPNGFNDCFNALKYIFENAEKYGVDKNKLGIGGDSAGGNLAAACALKDREMGSGMLKYQALIYPVVTFVSGGIKDYKWRIEDYDISGQQRIFIEPNLMMGRPKEEDEVDDFARAYLLHDENPRDPYISPLAAASHKDLCKAFIAVAEFDGLRIQGEIYGKKLLESEVDARVIRYKGVCHGFIDKLGVLPQAEDLIQEIANDIVAL
jgi:acetyl esterase/lipase